MSSHCLSTSKYTILPTGIEEFSTIDFLMLPSLSMSLAGHSVILAIQPSSMVMDMDTGPTQVDGSHLTFVQSSGSQDLEAGAVELYDG